MSILHFDQAKVSDIFPIIRKLIDLSGDIQITEKVDGVNLRAGVQGGKFYSSTKRGTRVFDADVPQAYDVDFLQRFKEVHEKLSSSNFVKIIDSFVRDNEDEIGKQVSDLDPASYDVELEFEFIGSRSNVIEYDPAHVGDGALVVLGLRVNGHDLTNTSVGSRLLRELKQSLGSGLHVHTMTRHDVDKLPFLSVGVRKDFEDVERILASHKGKIAGALEGRAKAVVDAVRSELVRNWVDLQDKNMLGGTEIEGLVIKDVKSGEVVKLVNRDKFTARLKQLWTYRNEGGKVIDSVIDKIVAAGFKDDPVIRDLATRTAHNVFKKRHGDVSVNQVEKRARGSWDPDQILGILEDAYDDLDSAWKRARHEHARVRGELADSRVVSDNEEAEGSEYRAHTALLSKLEDVARAGDPMKFLRALVPAGRWKKKLGESVKRITEGGHAFDDVGPVDRGSVKKVVTDVTSWLKSVGAVGVETIGTTGKKEQTGDIDLAVEFPDGPDALLQACRNEFGTPNVKRVGSVISMRYESDQGPVQVDLMVGRVGYLSWSRYGPVPGAGESKVKGVFRNLLLNAIARNVSKEQFGGSDDEQRRLVIDFDRGLFLVDRTKKGKGGAALKTWKQVAQKFVSDDPEEILEILLGKKVQSAEIRSLEGLVKSVRSSPNTHGIADRILEEYLSDLENVKKTHKGFEVPDEVYDIVHGKAESIVRDLVSEMLNEEILSLKGKRYFLTPDQTDTVEKYVTRRLGAEEYNPESKFEQWILGMGKQAALKIMGVLKNRVPQQIRDSVIDVLLEMNPKEVRKHAFAYDPVGSVTVPSVFVPLAELRLRGGVEIGRGEVVTLFMFDNVQMAGRNSPYDVNINGTNWHVKERRPSEGIRMGGAKGKLFSGSQLYKNLSAVVPPDELTEWSIGKIASATDRIVEAGVSDDRGQPIESVQDLQDALDRSLRERGVGADASGIIFYDRNVLHFVGTENIYCQGITKGTYIATSVPNKIAVAWKKSH